MHSRLTHAHTRTYMYTPSVHSYNQWHRDLNYNEDDDVSLERQRVATHGADGDTLVLHNLRKCFRRGTHRVVVVDNLSVGIPQGEVRADVVSFVHVHVVNSVSTRRRWLIDVNVCMTRCVHVCVARSVSVCWASTAPERRRRSTPSPARFSRPRASSSSRDRRKLPYTAAGCCSHVT